MFAYAMADIMITAAGRAADTPAWWAAEIIAAEGRGLDVARRPCCPEPPSVCCPGDSLRPDLPAAGVDPAGEN
ncbi:hypothetical protein [Nocardia sp. NPDC046763]|uniref:hypothetical protein n=1 Tax=Nocardia sp. NPDC046763 TaxID=3155256 RepID=UPI0033F1C0DE